MRKAVELAEKNCPISVSLNCPVEVELRVGKKQEENENYAIV